MDFHHQHICFPIFFCHYLYRKNYCPMLVDGKEESERFFYVNGTSSTLVIKNVQQGDFGDYVVSVANTQGTDNITFGLVTEGIVFCLYLLVVYSLSF